MIYLIWNENKTNRPDYTKNTGTMETVVIQSVPKQKKFTQPLKLAFLILI